MAKAAFFGLFGEDFPFPPVRLRPKVTEHPPPALLEIDRILNLQQQGDLSKEDLIWIAKGRARLRPRSMKLIGVLNRERWVFLANAERWTRILGWTEEEILSRGWRDLVAPEDLESVERAASVMETRELEGRYHNRVVCKDGTMVDVAWEASEWTSDGHAEAEGTLSPCSLSVGCPLRGIPDARAAGKR